MGPYKKRCYKKRSGCGDIQREEGHVKRKAEIGVRQLQAKDTKDCQLPPGTKKREARILP